ncbi:Protein stu1 [Smittium culicis]|uniref:Protein stu1 n=1 Tax=Smittium culicis TaxID=133412 RepID=A0A1R1XYL2_9FUNG|nr:Protein stu1 [Smittium culicis]
MSSDQRIADEISRSLMQGGSIDKKVSELNRINDILLKPNSRLPDKSFEKLIISISQSLNTSQSRVCLAALETCSSLISSLVNYSSYHIYSSVLNFIVKALISRLGDVKLEIRSQSVFILGKIFDSIDCIIAQEALSNYSTQSTLIDSSPNSYYPNDSLSQNAQSADPSPYSNLLNIYENTIISLAFSHKTSRVKEMALHWVFQTTVDYQSFLPTTYIEAIVDLLFDFNDSVRNAAKIILQNIYNLRPEIQQKIVDEISQRKNIKPNFITEITISRRPSSRLRAANVASPYREGLFNRGLSSRANSQLDSDYQRSATQDFSSLKSKDANKYYRSGSELGFRNNETRMSTLTPDIKNTISDRFTQSSKPPSSYKLPSIDKKSKPSYNQISPTKSSVSDVIPLFLDSPKALEREFGQRTAFFEGKESEENWSNREKSINYFRRVIYGNSPTDYPNDLYRELKKILPSLLKALTSLRTTLSTITIKLFEEIITNFADKASLFFDFIFENLLSLCSTTKKLLYQAAVSSLSVIISSVPINEKPLKLLSKNLDSKNIPLRQSSITISAYLLFKRDFEVSSSLGKLVPHFTKLIHVGINDSSLPIRNESKSLYNHILQYHEDLADMIYNESNQSTKSSLSKLQGNKHTPNTSLKKSSLPAKSSPGIRSTKQYNTSQQQSSPTSVIVSRQNSLEKNKYSRSPYISAPKSLPKYTDTPMYNGRKLSNSDKYFPLPRNNVDSPSFKQYRNKSSFDKSPNKRNVQSQSSKLEYSAARSFTPTIESNSRKISHPQNNILSNYEHDLSNRLKNSSFVTDYNSLVRKEIYSPSVSTSKISPRNPFSPNSSLNKVPFDMQADINNNNHLQNKSSLDQYPIINSFDLFAGNSQDIVTDSKIIIDNKPIGLSINDYNDLSASEKLELLTNFNCFDSIYSSFGFSEPQDELTNSAIYEYFTAQLVIESFIFKTNKDQASNDVLKNLKLLSRYIKSDSSSWLWELQPLPLLNLNAPITSQSFSIHDLLYFNKSESLFARFASAILEALRLPLSINFELSQHLAALDQSRLLVRRKGHLVTDYNDANKLFWELLRFKAFNDQSVVGSTDATLDQILISFDKKVLLDLLTSLLKRCPLPEISFIFESDSETTARSFSSECDLKPELVTPRLDDPYNILNSTRVLGYGLDILSTYISKFYSEELLDISEFMIYLIKAMYHPRSTVRESAVFTTIALKEKLKISDSVFSEILNNQTLTVDFIQSENGEADSEKHNSVTFYLEKYAELLDSNYKSLSQADRKFFSFLLLLDKNHRNLVTLVSAD